MRALILDIHPTDAYADVKHQLIGEIGIAEDISSTGENWIAIRKFKFDNPKMLKLTFGSELADYISLFKVKILEL